jgi:membrane-bound lytic murein transglycosylase B
MKMVSMPTLLPRRYPLRPHPRHPLPTPPAAAAISNSFIAGVSADARAAEVSPNVISSALGGVQQDGGVLAFDRRQRYTFNKSFEQYVSTRVGAGASMAAAP